MEHKHTAEPWTAWETTFSGPDGMIGEVGFGKRDDHEMIANVKRIVACVNACARISTKTLIAVAEEQADAK